MLTELKIENVILAKLAALNLPGCRLTGAWHPVDEGEVKGVDAGEAAAIAVAVGQFGFAGFQDTMCDADVTLAITIRRDLCPTGEALAEYTEPVATLLRRWNTDYEAVFSDFTVPGFSPGGFRLNPGSGPDYNKDLGIWIISQTFTIRGVIDRD